ncbi:MAG: bis(5'-nucleosyl)-tetraphosphatase (symmetrical) YqeK [Lachnospiraceae bacterium]|nr:bis(5'-nucleosyl)-tetraphosphatase (symmetrical) YqeK [Lachnospiraceae bacterium]
MDATISKILKDIRPQMKCERYEHSLGVMYTSASLAFRYEYDPYKAMLAGVLHDCAKIYTCKDYVAECNEYGIEATPQEIALPHLLHAPLGAYYAEHKYGVTDPEILHAIRVHTLAGKDLSILDKIVYVADYIEPSRKDCPQLAKIRVLAYTDIDKAILAKLESVINYLKKCELEITDSTYELLDYYKDICKGESHE